MHITLQKIEPPIEGTPERPNGRKSYKITTANGIVYYAKPEIGRNLNEGEYVGIEFNTDKRSYKWINEVTPVKDVNEDLKKIKKTFPNSEISNVYEGGEEPTATPTSIKPTMTPKDFLIVLQSCVNRQADWTPNQKLKFILDNYYNGVIATHKSLDEGVL